MGWRVANSGLITGHDMTGVTMTCWQEQAPGLVLRLVFVSELERVQHPSPDPGPGLDLKPYP